MAAPAANRRRMIAPFGSGVRAPTFILGRGRVMVAVCVRRRTDQTIMRARALGTAVIVLRVERGSWGNACGKRSASCLLSVKRQLPYVKHTTVRPGRGSGADWCYAEPNYLDVTSFASHRLAGVP